MSISLYDASVLSFRQVLGGVAGYLEKARAHVSEAGGSPDSLLDKRLADDMWPLRSQIISVVHHARGAYEGAKAGVFRPPVLTGEYDYAGLQALVAEAKAMLDGLSPDEVNALEGKDMVFELGPRQMPFTVEGFWLSFSMPNLHFHATTGYDILRQAGVPLGKRDYMGQLRLKM